MSDNIMTENPNHKLIILVIKHKNSLICILGECLIVRIG